MTDSRDERIADYLAGTMEPRERTAFEEQLLADDALAEEIYAETALTEAFRRAGTAEAARQAETRIVPIGSARLAWWKVALPLAAAITLIAIPLVQRDRTPGTGPVLRGADSAFTLVEPAGAVQSLARFSWNADPEAASYELIIRDAAARVVWRTTTTGTWIEPPADAIPPDLASGTWTVRAIDADGFSRGSRSAEFSRQP